MEKHPMTRTGESLTMAEVSVHVAIDPINFGEGDLRASDETYEQAKATAELAKNYLVATSKHAPGQCMDGRCCATTKSGTETIVGPKAAGGPVVTALAAMEYVGGYFDADMTYKDKIGVVNSYLTQAEMQAGTHITKGALANNFINPQTGAAQTGCGASEKYVNSTAAIRDGDQDVILTTQSLTGRTFISKDSKSDAVNTYDPLLLWDLVSSYSNGNHGEILEGVHDEALVLFNKIKNTTIDRDAFVTETGKQVFVIDLWYIEEIAEALVYGSPDAETKKSKLVDTMIAFQVATYKMLCDGSHRTAIFTDEVSLAA
jgi:hypothetical protein